MQAGGSGLPGRIVSHASNDITDLEIELAEVGNSSRGRKSVRFSSQSNNSDDEANTLVSSDGIEHFSMMANPLTESPAVGMSLGSSTDSTGLQIVPEGKTEPRIDYSQLSSSLLFAKGAECRTSTRRNAATKRSRTSAAAKTASLAAVAAAQAKREDIDRLAATKAAALAAELAAEAAARKAAEEAAKALTDEWEAYSAAEAAAKLAADEWEAYAAAEADIKSAAEVAAKAKANAAAEAAADEWEAYSTAEAAAKAAAEEWEAYYRKQQQDGGKDAEEDEWKIYLDADSGYYYRLNTRTGETVWCEYSEEDGGGEEAPPVVAEKQDDEEAQETPLAEDSLATARSRLKSVMQRSCSGDNSMPSELQNLISDTRGDWVEVCDWDGQVLGAQLRGKTVYYHQKTYETRLNKPSGWVRMQAQALSRELCTRDARRQAKRLSAFAKPAPMHRDRTNTVGRWNRNISQ